MNIVNLVISFCDHCVILCNICAKCLEFFFLRLLKASPWMRLLWQKAAGYDVGSETKLIVHTFPDHPRDPLSQNDFLTFLNMFLVTCVSRLQETVLHLFHSEEGSVTIRKYVVSYLTLKLRSESQFPDHQLFYIVLNLYISLVCLN